LAWLGLGQGFGGEIINLNGMPQNSFFLQFCTAIMADHGRPWSIADVHHVYMISQRHFKSLVYYAGDKD
jgi:hypothetical protein